MVLVKSNRYPRDCRQLALLSGRYRVIQVEPLGFGASGRPHDYPRAGLHEQVLAVADREAVGRFVVWGYSQGGAMAAMVAQASPRVAGMIAGGFSPATEPTAAWSARMEREQRVPAAARAFWQRFARFDWTEELAAMGCPRLLYAGQDDSTRAAGLRRTLASLTDGGATVVEFDGLDHRTCNDEPAMSARIVPAVAGWLNDRVGSSW